jgi:RIO kinase 1
MQQTEEELKEVVRNWLDAGVGLQDDSSKLETPTDGTTSTSTAATSLAQDDAVFMSSYIPRNLGEVYDPERDIDRINKGQGEDLIYAGITGLNTHANGKAKANDASAPKEEGGAAEAVADRSRRPSVKSVRFEDEQDESEDESEDSDDDESERKPRGFRHEDKEAKKVCTSGRTL